MANRSRSVRMAFAVGGELINAGAVDTLAIVSIDAGDMPWAAGTSVAGLALAPRGNPAAARRGRASKRKLAALDAAVLPNLGATVTRRVGFTNDGRIDVAQSCLLGPLVTPA